MINGPLLLVGLAIVMLGLTIYQALASRRFAPWIPSHMGLLRQALTKLSPAPDQRFIDIGCGDGRAVILAAREFKLRATGVEISPILWAWATTQTVMAGVSSTTDIKLGNLYKTNLSDYSLVYIFGLPRTIKHNLLKKFQAELKPGSLVLSYNFLLPDKEPLWTLQEKYRSLRVYQF